jgi:hypothetical protein
MNFLKKNGEIHSGQFLMLALWTNVHYQSCYVSSGRTFFTREDSKCALISAAATGGKKIYR